MLSKLFLSDLNSAKNAVRALLNHTEENGYRAKIVLPAGLDKWDMSNLKKYYKTFTGEEITDKFIVENKMNTGEKLTRFIVKKAKEAGYSFTADFESYASGVYDRKTEFFISTNPFDLLSPSDFSTYKSCFAEGGMYAHGVPKWALMPGIAILFSQANDKKNSRAWLYFYNENGKKGFLMFKNYGSSFDDEAMRRKIADILEIKEYKKKDYSYGIHKCDTYVDSFTAVREETEGLKTSMLENAFINELEREDYECPICGSGTYRRNHIACCGSIKEALRGTL